VLPGLPIVMAASTALGLLAVLAGRKTS
jgi:hypothetical protein